MSDSARVALRSYIWYKTATISLYQYARRGLHGSAKDCHGIE